MKLIVRPLNAHDRAGWASMWAQYLNFYDSAVTPEIYNLTFARLIDQTHKTQNCLVAELDSSLVGLVHFIYHPHNWQVEDVCYLQDLFVIPNKRGQGIGGTLIEEVYAIADSNKTPSVYWMTQSFNANARILYDKVANLTQFIKYSR